MFNEAPNVKVNGKLMYPRTDALFQLHHEAIWKNPKNRSDEKHYEWLKSGETPTVYMQDAYPEVPKSLKYPIKEVLSLVKNVKQVVNGEEKIFKYFSSTPDYAFALVAHLWKQGKRYQHVEVHGIELTMESEYQYQRTGFGFWIGYLAGLGIDVVLYNSIFDSPMYGYEGDIVVSSKEIEKRIADLNQELGNDKEQYAKEAQAFLGNLSGLLRKNIAAEIEKELNDITQRNERAGILSGKIKESQRYLEKAKVMEESARASVFSPGEFDGTRIAYRKQYDQTRAEATILNARIGEHLKKLLNQKKGSQKRQRALDEFGNMVAELMNKNMLLLHVVGAMQENQFYLDLYKLNLQFTGGRT